MGVGENERKPRPGCLCTLKGLNGRGRAFDYRRRHFPLFDRILKDSPIGGIVIHHQDRHAGELRHIERFGRQLGELLPGQLEP